MTNKWIFKVIGYRPIMKLLLIIRADYMKANCFNGLKHLHTLIQEGEESTFKVSLQSANKQQGEEETQQIIGYPSVSAIVSADKTPHQYLQ